MAKIVKTRVQNKHDIEANWNLATSFIPLKGELIVYDPDSTHAKSRFKFGDGVINADGSITGTPVTKLPFAHITDEELSAINAHLNSAHAPEDAQKNVQADWDEDDDSSDAYIKNKPAIPTDTNTTYDLAAAKSKSNGNVTIDLKAGGSGSGTDSVKIKGSGATTVTTDANGVITISSTDTDTDTHNSHAIISGKKADGSTDIKGSASSGDITLGDSGVAAGEYGPTANATPGYGSTFNVPDIKVNSKGIVTSITNRTVKIPAEPTIPAETTLTIEDKTATDTATTVFAVTNLEEGGINGHSITPTYKEVPTKKYVDDKIGELGQAMVFLGSTTTEIFDGATTNPITVNSEPVTAVAGNVVLYGGYEYVWIGTAWEQFGQEGSFSLKTHTHTVSYKPAGTVTAPTITVTPNTKTVNSITAVGSLPSLTYEEVEASKITEWDAGSAPSLTFTQGSLPSASLSGGSASLTGSVSTGPNRTVTLTHSHSNPTLTFSAGTLPTATFSAGSVPSLTYEDVSVANIKAWSAGTLPTKGSNTTVVTSIKSATATEPIFTGTPATITTSNANS